MKKTFLITSIACLIICSACSIESKEEIESATEIDTNTFIKKREIISLDSNYASSEDSLERLEHMAQDSIHIGHNHQNVH